MTHLMITLGVVWAVTAGCVFGFGWYAREYTTDRRAERARAAFPATVLLSRPAPPTDAEATAIDIGRWWPALERAAGPDTTPISQVALSNWEARVRRDTDAWLHDRGLL